MRKVAIIVGIISLGISGFFASAGLPFRALVVLIVGLIALTLVACEELPAANVSGEEVSLPDALAENLVEAEIEGTGAASGASIVLRMRRIQPRDLTVVIPTGTALLSSDASEQDMVVRQASERIVLNDDDWHEFVLEAYCLEAHRDNPSDGASLSLGQLLNPDVLTVLEAVDQTPEAAGNVMAIQAAVWAITDNISRRELDDVGYRLSSDDLETVRAIIAAAEMNPGAYKLFQGS